VLAATMMIMVASQIILHMISTRNGNSTTRLVPPWDFIILKTF
jgi:hypothetical protein